jgi:hypothetical protein
MCLFFAARPLGVSKSDRSKRISESQALNSEFLLLAQSHYPTGLHQGSKSRVLSHVGVFSCLSPSHLRATGVKRFDFRFNSRSCSSGLGYPSLQNIHVELLLNYWDEGILAGIDLDNHYVAHRVIVDLLVVANMQLIVRLPLDLQWSLVQDVEKVLSVGTCRRYCSSGMENCARRTLLG